jgi:hypothetical protein
MAVVLWTAKDHNLLTVRGLLVEMELRIGQGPVYCLTALALSYSYP